MQQDLLMFVLVKFAPLFNTQKKHVLIYFAFEMDPICTTENREHVVEGRGFFPHTNLCGKNTLSEHIVYQAMLFLICFRK